MVKKYIVFSVILFSLLFLFHVSPVNAERCTAYSNSYGEWEECVPDDMTINKQVQNPITGDYVENITTGMFSKGDTVVFKLTIKNNSGETFQNVRLEDKLPDNLDFVDSDPNGDYNSDDKYLTINLGDVSAGEERVVYLWAKWVGPYPNEDLTCRDNWSKTKSDQRPDGFTDTARVCMTQKVLGVTTLPAAGFSDIALIIPFALSGIGGMALLRRKAK